MDFGIIAYLCIGNYFKSECYQMKIYMRKVLIVALMVVFCTSSSSAQTRKKVYDEEINPMEQIDKAVLKAQAEGKYVVCQVGGNWCPWCLRFADFITNDTDISSLINENFVYVHVNYNPTKSGDGKDSSVGASASAGKERAEALMRRLNNAGRFGFPVFVVLNGDGNVIHIQDSSFLEEGQGYDKEKVLRFFKNWTPEAVNK